MLKICLVGVEGVGKTWLTKFLAQHFQTHFAIEYGDFYCKNVLNGYMDSGIFLTTKDDFIKIVHGQRQLWTETITKSQKQGFCFFDTDHVYTKYFIDKQFANWNWVDQYIKVQPIDLFIFLKSDQVFIRSQNLITKQTIVRETTLLLQYYRKWVTSEKLIVVETNDYSKRHHEVATIVQKYLTKNGF